MQDCDAPSQKYPTFSLVHLPQVSTFQKGHSEMCVSLVGFILMYVSIYCHIDVWISFRLLWYGCIAEAFYTCDT